ncbi:hypothetical protein P7K49_040183, partial [Saguinus oedipus]
MGPQGPAEYSPYVTQHPHACTRLLTDQAHAHAQHSALCRHTWAQGSGGSPSCWMLAGTESPALAPGGSRMGQPFPAYAREAVVEPPLWLGSGPSALLEAGPQAVRK